MLSDEPSQSSLIGVTPTDLPAREIEEAIFAPQKTGSANKLFACNMGEYVDIPQLVVVDNQSSGKNSVLEALTNLSFLLVLTV